MYLFKATLFVLFSFIYIMGLSEASDLSREEQEAIAFYKKGMKVRSSGIEYFKQAAELGHTLSEIKVKKHTISEMEQALVKLQAENAGLQIAYAEPSARFSNVFSLTEPGIQIDSLGIELMEMEEEKNVLEKSNPTLHTFTPQYSFLSDSDTVEHRKPEKSEEEIAKKALQAISAKQAEYKALNTRLNEIYARQKTPFAQAIVQEIITEMDLDAHHEQLQACKRFLKKNKTGKKAKKLMSSIANNGLYDIDRTEALPGIALGIVRASTSPEIFLRPDMLSDLMALKKYLWNTIFRFVNFDGDPSFWNARNLIRAYEAAPAMGRYDQMKYGIICLSEAQNQLRGFNDCDLDDLITSRNYSNAVEQVLVQHKISFLNSDYQPYKELMVTSKGFSSTISNFTSFSRKLLNVLRGKTHIEINTELLNMLVTEGDDESGRYVGRKMFYFYEGYSQNIYTHRTAHYSVRIKTHDDDRFSINYLRQHPYAANGYYDKGILKDTDNTLLKFYFDTKVELVVPARINEEGQVQWREGTTKKDQLAIMAPSHFAPTRQ